MPLYEFKCGGCGHEFEVLVRPPMTACTCPACNSADLERLLSMFAVSSEGTRQTALKGARKAAAKTWRDKEHAELEAMHDHHH